MIPRFPSFKNLELTDKLDIEKFTKDFPPYSDFNFTSLWCWDTRSQIQISELHNNLVVKFTDYLTGEPFYSFIGINLVNKTITDLFQLANKEGIIMKMKLIPEETIKLVDKFSFNIIEDRDNFDYILSTKDLSTYKGNKFGPKRNFVNRFKRNYLSTTKMLDLSNFGIQSQIKENCAIWALQKELNKMDFEHEFIAISRTFSLNQTEIIAVGIFIEERLVAFSINEKLNHNYSILHFEKGYIDSYIGLFPFLMQETSRILSEAGRDLLNYEQDMGLIGLRQSKVSYNPTQYLKQYIITPI